VVHYYRYVKRTIPAEKKSRWYHQNRLLRNIIRSLERHFQLLSAHFHHPILVRNNNVTEHLIKQLNRKIKQSDGFKTRDNAENFLKLWFIHYRFKPFVNSSRSDRNGKAPLELARINIKNLYNVQCPSPNPQPLSPGHAVGQDNSCP